MYLHEDRDLFFDVVNAANEKLSIPMAVIEKDYYVTMILKLLSARNENCVFKGGTSLSKCFHLLDRFEWKNIRGTNKNLLRNDYRRGFLLIESFLPFFISAPGNAPSPASPPYLIIRKAQSGLGWTSVR